MIGGKPVELQPSTRLARMLALGIPALLLGGAYLSQYGFGLYPCEMCWWQRYPHFAAVAFGLLAFAAAPKRLWIALAAVAILVSGAIGAYHAGVEYGWWEGHTACTGVVAAGGDILNTLQDIPLVSCGQAQWTLLGISLAGWNFIVSTIAGLAILGLLLGRGGQSRGMI
ncbi:disulfide bond formation protein B [Erythrobacter sp. LQ02-29]|uniref:disulfide bond formation protein B n=1 Tax=Erythrobacter sp. LQ02-29 TaxID=2920384 RepID=UPI001F4E7C56|nr:disulfide bond formation protein B [Erythrobacter sp. LQ02-29]MCP9221796.1 disulfide bond formation protein B [Erythrobacter sp. LQ02-29]